MAQVSEIKIAEWKEKHGDVFAVEVNGETSYLRKPDRKVLSLALTKARKDSLDYVEAIVNNCFLGGATVDLKSPGVLMGLVEQIDQILEVAVVKVKKI